MKGKSINILIKVQEFILVLLIVLECNTVYHSISIGVSQTLLYIFAGNIAAYLLIFLWIKKDKSNIACIKNMKYLLLILFAFTMLFYAVNVVNTDSVGYLGYFMFFTDAMIILYSIYRKNGDVFRLIFKLEQVIVFICITSFILWIGSSILNRLGEGQDLYILWTGGDYYSNYMNLCVRRYWTGDITKNLGIFVEPPMYGLMITFCLYTELFLKKHMNAVIVVIFILSLVSCRAILGLMIALLAVFIKFLEMIRGKRYARIIIVASIVCGLAGIVLLLLYKRDSGWSSYATHIDDFAATLKCWKDNIFLGCGFGEREPIEAYMSEFRIGNKGLSNSLGMVLAQGGLYLFSFYMVPFVLLMVNFFRGNRRLAYWGGGAFALWVVIVFPYRLFSFFILGMGYAMIEIRENEKASAVSEVSDSKEQKNQEAHEKENVQGSKAEKKKISVSLIKIKDNLPEDGCFWDRDMLKLKSGVTVVSIIVMTVFSVWGLVKFGDNGAVAAVTAGIALGTEMAVVVTSISKKTKLESKRQLGIQAVLWIIMIVAGHLYSVADSLYTTIGMRIQDNWWMSLLSVIVLYSIGTVVCERNDKSKEYNVDRIS